MSLEGSPTAVNITSIKMLQFFHNTLFVRRFSFTDLPTFTYRSFDRSPVSFLLFVRRVTYGVHLLAVLRLLMALILADPLALRTPSLFLYRQRAPASATG